MNSNRYIGRLDPTPRHGVTPPPHILAALAAALAAAAPPAPSILEDLTYLVDMFGMDWDSTIDGQPEHVHLCVPQNIPAAVRMAKELKARAHVRGVLPRRLESSVLLQLSGIDTLDLESELNAAELIRLLMIP